MRRICTAAAAAAAAAAAQERAQALTLHRAPVGQGPSGPDWLAIAFGFWSGRALATIALARRGWVYV